MAAEFAELALEGVPVAVEHYDKVYYPLKNQTKKGVDRMKKMRQSRRRYESDSYSDSDDEFDQYHRSSPRAYKSSNGGDRGVRNEVITERHVIKTKNGRTKSVDRYHGNRGTSSRRRDYSSESESSISPGPRSSSRSRKKRQSLSDRALTALGLSGVVAATSSGRKDDRRGYRSDSSSRSRSRSRTRARRLDSRDGYYSARGTRASSKSRYYEDNRTPAKYKPSSLRDDSDGVMVRRDNQKSAAGYRGQGPQVTGGQSERRRDGSTHSRISVSSSDICSSGEDEKKIRKARGKEYLTAGLAAVATIHAVHGVYQSMEARDKRRDQVAKGKLEPDKARQEKKKARVHDVAALGIAALGIKGAYSEWKEVQETKEGCKQTQKQREENHERRLRKIEKYGCVKPRSNGYGSQRSQSEARSRS